ncbi:hypothetical protein [Shewanella algae]|uniref:hypothetical protein n=1 Tax=Shewanella algae TaxID=38313 RepID=UPI0005CC974D|nr:hypothetical protein [Shewanella algae]
MSGPLISDPLVSGHTETIQVKDYNPAVNFIDDDAIWGLLNNNRQPSPDTVRQVLEKARRLQGLTLEEVAVFL